MKKMLCLFLIAVMILCVSCAESDDENSSDTSAETVSEASSEEVSEEGSVLSEEESSEESAEEYSYPPESEELTAPTVYGCTKLYDDAFVVLGNCDEGARVFWIFDGQMDSTASDHGYYSIRVKAKKGELKIWEEKDGFKSRTRTYNARPKSVDPDEWKVIAGYDYQFHLDYTLNDFLCNNLYSQKNLDSLTSRLKKRAESSSAEIIYILVPSPATIYPETMPADYVRQSETSRLDQVMTAINNAGVKCIDVRALFNEHKNDEYKLYWKTDSHWTDYGAFLVYTELFNYIAETHPECAPHPFEDFDWVEDYYYGGDMSYYLEYYGGDMPMKEYNVLRKPRYEMPKAITSVRRYNGAKELTYDQNTMPAKKTISTNRPELPNAYVLRDSYSTQMYDILADGFNNTYFQGMWGFSYNKTDIENCKADYVIYIIVERNLDNVFN